MSDGFAAIPNWMIRDETITGPAVAVYVALASHSGKGGIFPGQDELAREARCSVRRVRDALAELEQLGVIERVRRSSRAGRSSDAYLLHPNGPDQQPALIAGSGQQPAPGAGATGRREHFAPLIEEEPIKNIERAFDEFWEAYPRRVGKQAARAKFEQLAKKQVDLEQVVAGARRFGSDPNLPEAQFVPHPTTWLSHGRWEDEEALPAREGAQEVVEVPRGQEWMWR